VGFIEIISGEDYFDIPDIKKDIRKKLDDAHNVTNVSPACNNSREYAINPLFLFYYLCLICNDKISIQYY